MPASIRPLALPTPPVTLAEAKDQCRVEAAFTADDAILNRLIAGACADATLECGVGVGYADWVMVLDGFPGGRGSGDGPSPYSTAFWPGGVFPGGFPGVGCGSPPPIALPVRPVLLVSAVTYYGLGGTLVTMDPAADYWVGPQTGRIAPAAGYWPATQFGRPECVRVEFAAGHTADDLPPVAKDAVLLIVADRYAHRGDGDANRRPIPEAARRLLWKLHVGDFI